MAEKQDWNDLNPGERREEFDDKVAHLKLVKELSGAEPPRTPKLISAAAALAGRKPQDWLVSQVIEKSYVYSLTAKSGSGKTAVALLLAFLIAAPDMYPRLLGNYEVEQGNVCYLAGENPTDVVRRMAGLCGHYRVEPPQNLSIVEGRFSLKEHVGTIAAQIPVRKPLSLVVVDTAQAFFEGNEENSNAEMLGYAQTLRKLTMLPGRPAVLCLSHPAKFVSAPEDLVPRGGSSFLNEIDANLTLWPGEGDLVFELSATKLRGPSFDAMQIELVRYTDDSFVDTKGRPSHTVVAQVMTEQEAEHRTDERAERETKILEAIAFAGTKGLRHSEIVEVTGLMKGTVTKDLKRLSGKSAKLEKDGNLWKLAKAKAAKKVNGAAVVSMA